MQMMQIDVLLHMGREVTVEPMSLHKMNNIMNNRIYIVSYKRIVVPQTPSNTTNHQHGTDHKFGDCRPASAIA